jgi:hypothetical protein
VSPEPPAEGAITAVLLAGDQSSNDSDCRPLPTPRAAVGVELEAAVEQIVADAAEQLTAVLEAFDARAEHGEQPGLLPRAAFEPLRCREVARWSARPAANRFRPLTRATTGMPASNERRGATSIIPRKRSPRRVMEIGALA